jgi:hypothetical protein
MSKIIHERLHHTDDERSTVILICEETNYGCVFTPRIKFFDNIRTILVITLNPRFDSQDECFDYLTAVAVEIEEVGDFVDWLERDKVTKDEDLAKQRQDDVRPNLLDLRKRLEQDDVKPDLRDLRRIMGTEVVAQTRPSKRPKN